MTQAEWNARVASRPGLWQYFKLDDASGFPQDSSGNDADMDTIGSGQTLDYNAGGPFSGADGLDLQTFGAIGVLSAVQDPPTNTANYSHLKTMEAWVNIQAVAATNALTLIAAGNIGIVMDTDRTVKIARWANPNTFSGSSTTTLEIGEWFFIMATSTGGTDMDLYVNDTLEVSTSQAWPVPNDSLLRLGALPEFGELGTQRAIYSNAALYDAGNLTPDLDFQPFTPQFIRYGR